MHYCITLFADCYNIICFVLSYLIDCSSHNTWVNNYIWNAHLSTVVLINVDYSDFALKKLVNFVMSDRK